MRKVKKQMSKSKVSGSQKATSKPTYETPKDGDRINVAFKGHPDSWWGPLYYRSVYDDKERGKIFGACVLTEDWSEPGKLSVPFEEVEFWSIWEGETKEEYQERKERIIADLQQKKIPIDPFDSFIGENSIQGEWSKPKIGPAFKAVPIKDRLVRPRNEDLVEVQARNYSEIVTGVYLKAADSIYSRNRLVEKATIENGRTEIIYDKRFRYGVPKIPFAEWIRWRLIGDSTTEWQPGPLFEKWSQEERKLLAVETREANKKLLEDSKAMVRQFMKEETILTVRLIRLKDMRSNVANAGYKTEFDAEGGLGKSSLDEWTKFLEGEIDILERALNLMSKIASDQASIDDLNSSHGPYSYSVKELAGIAGMTPSGVRKELNSEKPTIKGVRVYFERNNDRKHARYFISDSSFEKIKRKVSFSSEHN
jgi:hypothetical protein